MHTNQTWYVNIVWKNEQCSYCFASNKKRNVTSNSNLIRSHIQVVE